MIKLKRTVSNTPKIRKIYKELLEAWWSKNDLIDILQSWWNCLRSDDLLLNKSDHLVLLKQNERLINNYISWQTYWIVHIDLVKKLIWSIDINHRAITADYLNQLNWINNWQVLKDDKLLQISHHKSTNVTLDFEEHYRMYFELKTVWSVNKAEMKIPIDRFKKFNWDLREQLYILSKDLVTQEKQLFEIAKNGNLPDVLPKNIISTYNILLIAIKGIDKISNPLHDKSINYWKAKLLPLP